MTNKKKIALLNMRYDNNYGGNLQRYAMVTILQRMGYNVEYLYIRDNWDDWFDNKTNGKIIKQSVKQIIRHLLHPTQEPWLAWKREGGDYCKTCKITEPFLEKYIPHTQPIYSHGELEIVFRGGDFDAIIAGSDQIWRKQFVERYGLGTWFFDFLPDDYKGIRVVYGASFGVAEQEYTKEEQESLRHLFNRFNAVSLRETSGLKLLKDYGWTIPQAEWVLDPTLLLSAEDYSHLIDMTETQEPEGDMFCYILDRTEEIDLQIQNIAKQNMLIPFVRSIRDENPCSIEQWLRYMRDAKFIYTDSYHGLLFAIIFHKPFYLMYNSFRGNARFDSVLAQLEIDLENPNYEKIFKKLEQYKQQSLGFLTKVLQ